MTINEFMGIIYFLIIACLLYLAAKACNGKDRVMFYLMLYIDFIVLAFTVISIAMR